MKEASLSKVVKRRVERTIDFATPEGLVGVLREYAEKRDLPIFEILSLLAQRRVQSVSFTKDIPYFHFYARANSGQATIHLETGKNEYKIPLDLSQLLAYTQHLNRNAH